MTNSSERGLQRGTGPRHYIVPCALALSLLCGCPQDRPSVLWPIVRFVERDHPGVVPARLPTATVQNDTRRVLSAPRYVLLGGVRKVPVSDDRRVRLERRLALLYRGQAAVIQPVYRRQERWVRHRASLVPILREGRGPRVVVDFRIPGSERVVELKLEAWAAPESRRTEHESAEIDIPPGAVLSFAMAVLEVAREQGPVRFEVRICEGEACESLHREELDPARPGTAWLERELDLASHAGRRVRFRFETLHLTERTGAFSFPVWGDPTLWEPRRRAPGELNMILVSFDTLGARHLPVYGYPRDTAPFLTELAERGTLFERCLAPANNTAPSHMTMFTSLQPSAHGVMGAIAGSRLPDAVLTLADSLRAAGLAVAGYTENGPLSVQRGFGRGFNPYFEWKSGRRRVIGDARGTFERGAEWLLRNRERRFLLFLHTYQVHTPYTPDPEYSDYFTETPSVLAHQLGMPPDYAAANYDREIRYLDDEFRRFFEELDRAGVFEDTILVVTSDHGEAFLEHGYVFHTGGLHDEILHVPLVFYGPGIPPGRRVETQVGLIDLMPTLLDLFNLEPGSDAMGRSFASLLHGEDAAGSWEERPLFSESRSKRRFVPGPGRLGLVRQGGVAPSLAVRRAGRKLIMRGEVEQLYYDLRADPLETRNLLPDSPGAAADLEALLDTYLPAMNAVHERLEARQPGSEEPARIDPEREDELRALGYLD